MGLRVHGYDVLLADTDSTAESTAAVKSGGHVWDRAQAPGLVIVATPPKVTAGVIRNLAEQFSDAVIADVSSVKESVFKGLLDVTNPERLVGSHPMAGREVSGASAAQANLFVDRPWVITRTEHTSHQAAVLIEDVVTTLGAVPVHRTMADHDRAVALVSHTPQVVASVLAAQLELAPPSDVELAGQGIRDTIRIAGSEPGLWTQILEGNAINVAADIDAVADGLKSAAQALRAGDHETIDEILAKGRAGRDRLPGKHGTGKADTVTMVVRVPDKPGALASLFTAAAKVNVNLEDVRIDHAMGRMTGLVELAVDSSAASELRSALEAADFSVVS